MEREQIRKDIAAWKEHITFYESQLAEAEKYGDTGQRDTALEMIRYSNQKIDELERRLVRRGA